MGGGSWCISLNKNTLICLKAEELEHMFLNEHRQLNSPLGFFLQSWRLEVALGHQHQCSETMFWSSPGLKTSCLHAVIGHEKIKTCRVHSIYFQLSELEFLSFVLTHLIGWRSNMGGWSSASSMAVMPTAQISHRWLYPPFFSTAATSGAILDRRTKGEERENQK